MQAPAYAAFLIKYSGRLFGLSLSFDMEDQESPSQLSMSLAHPKVAKLKRGFHEAAMIRRNGGLSEMKDRLILLSKYLSDPTRQPSPRVVKFYNNAVKAYEKAVKSSIGMPTYSDSVTTQSEAPADIPTLPLDGYQLVHRVCHVQKLASLGAAAGGFYATLFATDLAPFVKNNFFRIKSVTSWTVNLPDKVGSGFAGVQVPYAPATDGTEVMPIWCENWTPIGKGYAGIKTLFPLGDFPQVSAVVTTPIVNHFVSLGGTGGVTGVPVVFHAEIECLV